LEVERRRHIGIPREIVRTKKNYLRPAIESIPSGFFGPIHTLIAKCVKVSNCPEDPSTRKGTNTKKIA